MNATQSIARLVIGAAVLLCWSDLSSARDVVLVRQGAAGQTWRVEESVTCVTSQRGLTRVASTGEAIDPNDLPSQTLSATVSRTIEFDPPQPAETTRGRVTFSEARMTVGSPPAASSWAIANHTLSFRTPPGADGIIQGPAEVQATYLANDRFAALLSIGDHAVLERTGTAWKISDSGWNVLGGAYLGSPGNLVCTLTSDAADTLDFDCSGDGTGAGGTPEHADLKVSLDGGGDWAKGATLSTRRRSKDSFSRSMADRENEVDKTIECTVTTTQVQQ